MQPVGIHSIHIYIKRKSHKRITLWRKVAWNNERIISYRQKRTYGNIETIIMCSLIYLRVQYIGLYKYVYNKFCKLGLSWIDVTQSFVIILKLMLRLYIRFILSEIIIVSVPFHFHFVITKLRKFRSLVLICWKFKIKTKPIMERRKLNNVTKVQCDRGLNLEHCIGVEFLWPCLPEVSVTCH